MNQNQYLSQRNLMKIFGFTEQERLYWQVNQERLDEIIDDDQTIIHKVKESSNTFGKFLFVTNNRQGNQGRIDMTFVPFQIQ